MRVWGCKRACECVYETLPDNKLTHIVELHTILGCCCCYSFSVPVAVPSVVAATTSAVAATALASVTAVSAGIKQRSNTTLIDLVAQSRHVACLLPQLVACIARSAAEFDAKRV